MYTFNVFQSQFRPVAQAQHIDGWANKQNIHRHSLTYVYIMASYTNTEYLDMILIYGETGHNLGAVERLYREQYPHRWHPSANTIL